MAGCARWTGRDGVRPNLALEEVAPFLSGQLEYGIWLDDALLPAAFSRLLVANLLPAFRSVAAAYLGGLQL